MHEQAAAAAALLAHDTRKLLFQGALQLVAAVRSGACYVGGTRIEAWPAVGMQCAQTVTSGQCSSCASRILPGARDPKACAASHAAEGACHWLRRLGAQLQVCT